MRSSWILDQQVPRLFASAIEIGEDAQDNCQVVNATDQRNKVGNHTVRHLGCVTGWLAGAPKYKSHFISPALPKAQNAVSSNQKVRIGETLPRAIVIL